MFVLLEHRPPAASPSPSEQVHWDFLVEAAGQELLPAWRLSANPITAPGEIAAQRIPDHRRLYLEYEGEVSGGRGSVQRLDRGTATIDRLAGDELDVVLAGRHLVGRFEVVRTAAGATIWRRCD